MRMETKEDKIEKITFNTLESKMKNYSKKTIIVVCPDKEEILESIQMCIELCNFILIGGEKKIKEIAKKLAFPLEKVKIINCDDPIKCTEEALGLINSNQGDMLMKGSLSSKDILKQCFREDIGIRTGKLITSVCLFEIPNLEKLIFFGDPAVVLRPTLEQKKQLIEYFVEVANSIGINNPKIAVLTAIEQVNPKMVETTEADALSKMNDNGEIKGCIVDGPISFDIAIDPKAAEVKGAEKRKISGDADGLLFPDIHSANFIYKTFTHLMNAKCGVIIVGTKVPIILTSRSDTPENKKNSILLSCYYAEFLKSKNTSQ